jgi:hypothetical protein
MNDDSVHEKLLGLMHRYYSMNLHWEGKRTHTAGIELRKLLSDIKTLCSARREEIQAIRETKPKLKSPKYRQSLLTPGDTDKT